MRVEHHPAVEQDLTEPLRFYDLVSGRLAGEFKAELRRAVAVAAAKPGRFHLIEGGFHRANLKRFPYHFIRARHLIPLDASARLAFRQRMKSANGCRMISNPSAGTFHPLAKQGESSA